MTSRPAPKKPQAPTPAPAKLKPLPFAFPFLRKGQGKSEASAPFTDEHEIYRLLAEREASGTYLVSRKGMWHGGIHVTEAGAGQSLDLDAGLRCIADGVLIAFRANKTYPVSNMDEAGGGSPVQAPYSTGFALVRHTMEFPLGAKLTFYSLYMHLMSWEDYANFPKRDKPSYWLRQWKVTQYAQDKPSAGRNGQVADPLQQGLRVRKTRKRGTIIGILPQGASVTIGKKEEGWGQVMDLHSASMYPPEVGGYVAPSDAIGRWVFLGQENGGPVVEGVIDDSMFDRVITTTNQTSTTADPQGEGGGIPIKAGELIGHLGRYDSLSQCTSGTRMAHIEVFCDDHIQSFLQQGRAWVNQHGAHKEDWAALGLPTEPTILRIAPGTVLFQQQDKKFVPGADPQSRKMDAVQVYSLAELARDSKRRIPEPHPKLNPGYPVSWWHVDGVNAQGQPIDGWVCDFNHPGRVTREFAQKWIDFECLADAHDPAHTIFATTPEWVDYASGANVADVAARSKFSPLMLKVYDALFTKGDGKQAAHELCMLPQTERGEYPWLMQAASRLIVKHESEWANSEKWKQLIAELEKQTAPKQQHEEEQKRIEKLAWWDEVKTAVPGFPEADVYHINPIAITGNFSQSEGGCDCGCCMTVTGTRFKRTADTYWYGPQHAGSISLGDCLALATLRTNGTISETEEKILRAMAQNEGKVDTVQAIDIAIISAGAMQKTIRGSESKGELAEQIAVFRDAHPDAYEQYFSNCGWTVTGSGREAVLGYAHSTFTNGDRLVGDRLFAALRRDFSKETMGKPVKCPPVASMAHAMASPLYQELQIKDFIDRLNQAIDKAPSGYPYRIRDYLQSPLGRATVLDQDVNWPRATPVSVKSSLDRFFQHNPQVSRNPAEWGANRSTYEASLLQDYGPSRSMAQVNGESVAPARFHHLVQALGMPS